MQVARLSHRHSSLLINPSIASRDAEGGQRGVLGCVCYSKQEGKNWKRRRKHFCGVGEHSVLPGGMFSAWGFGLSLCLSYLGWKTVT